MTEEKTTLDEGINSLEEDELEEEDSETAEEEESEVQEQQKQKEQPKLEKVDMKKDAPKLLNERNTLRQEVENLKTDLALEKLGKNFGEFDTEKVKEIKKANPTLEWEDAYYLWERKHKVETKKESNLGLPGRKVSNPTRTITEAELSKYSQAEYNKARKMMEEGKLILKG